MTRKGHLSSAHIPNILTCRLEANELWPKKEGIDDTRKGLALLGTNECVHAA